MKIFFYVATIIIFLAIVSSLSTDTQERTEYKMGTFVSIRLFGFKWYKFDSAFNKAFSAIDNISNIANMYKEDSEVSRVNKIAYKSPVVVSNDLFLLIKDSKALYDASGGAFDITVAPLVELWGPYQDRDAVPDKESIQSVLHYVGSDKLVLDHQKRTVFFKKEGMKIDLSAIAKGYAVDKSIEAIKECGFSSALVNAGGDIFCLGKKDFLFSWRIGIQDPRKREGIVEILRLSDSAVATSGGYEQYFVYKDKDYTHLLHPKTGYPVESVFSSTTVIAKRCFIADAIATAVAVGGRDLISGFKEIYKDIIIIAYE
ncbi:MAG: FAD:protein FMN transferase [Candidatus Orphnella occulta]|nr:FAD:protein FMN transferase [Candidatus Orphnella occulta]MDP8296716.1 FAD:protein FMN transferase [Candidatus Orphnella occulta]